MQICPLPCCTSIILANHLNVIFLLIGQYCNYACVSESPLSIQCPWYNNVIYLESGAYGYWDCDDDCRILPNPSNLCMYIEVDEYHDARSKCNRNKSCSIEVIPHDIKDTPCCPPGQCENQQTHVTALIWSCIPGTVY